MTKRYRIASEDAVNVYIRMDGAVHSRAKAYAEAKGVSLAAAIERLVSDHFSEPKSAVASLSSLRTDVDAVATTLGEVVERARKIAAERVHAEDDDEIVGLAAMANDTDPEPQSTEADIDRLAKLADTMTPTAPQRVRETD